jgi:hypothetical protein
MMWILTIALAMAATPEEVAAELPAARLQLEACAEGGCERSDGARAAWVVALGTYLETGVADGAVAATVRELDSQLYSDLPDVLQKSASEPLSWATRVGGVAIAEPSKPLAVVDPMSSEERVNEVMSSFERRGARVFVVTSPNAKRDWDNPKLGRELRKRLARPAAKIHPGGDFCQEAPLSMARREYDESAPAATLSFARRGAFDPKNFASEYQTFVGGNEVVITDIRGLMKLPLGTYQVAMLRSDGAGAVLEYDLKEDGGLHEVRERADQCAEEALGSVRVVKEHFERLAKRLPEAELYLVDLRDDRVKDAPSYYWRDNKMFVITSDSRKEVTD